MKSVKNNKKKEMIDLKYAITVFKKAINGSGTDEAIKWGEKYLKKLEKKLEKLKCTT